MKCASRSAKGVPDPCLRTPGNRECLSLCDPDGCKEVEGYLELPGYDSSRICDSPTDCFGCCAKGYTGALCGVCANGYTPIEGGTICAPCMGGSVRRNMIIVGVLGVMLVVLFLYAIRWLVKNDPGNKANQLSIHEFAFTECGSIRKVKEHPCENCHGSGRDRYGIPCTECKGAGQVRDGENIGEISQQDQGFQMHRTLREYAKTVVDAIKHSCTKGVGKVFRRKMKVVVSFYQVATSIPVYYPVNFPHNFRSILGSFNFINLDPMQIAPVNCISPPPDYYQKYVARMSLPVVASLITLYIWKNAPSKRNVISTVYLLFLFAVYPSMCAATGASYRVTWVDDPTDPSDSSTHKIGFLTDDLSKQVRDAKGYTDDYWMFHWIDFICMGIYPFGIPFFFFIILYTNKVSIETRLMEREIPDEIKYVGCLCSAYERDCWWWEIYECVRKCSLVMVPILIWNNKDSPESWHSSQIIMAIAICIFSMGFFQFYAPFISDIDDILAYFGYVTLTFIFILAACQRFGDEVRKFNRMSGHGDVQKEIWGLKEEYLTMIVALMTVLVLVFGVLSAFYESALTEVEDNAFIELFDHMTKLSVVSAKNRNLCYKIYNGEKYQQALIATDGHVVIDDTQRSQSMFRTSSPGSVNVRGGVDMRLEAMSDHEREEKSKKSTKKKLERIEGHILKAKISLYMSEMETALNQVKAHHLMNDYMAAEVGEHVRHLTNIVPRIQKSLHGTLKDFLSGTNGDGWTERCDSSASDDEEGNINRTMHSLGDMLEGSSMLKTVEMSTIPKADTKASSLAKPTSKARNLSQDCEFGFDGQEFVPTMRNVGGLGGQSPMTQGGASRTLNASAKGSKREGAGTVRSETQVFGDADVITPLRKKKSIVL